MALSFWLLALLGALACATTHAGDRVLRLSDVVSMYRPSEEIARVYGITWQAWGGKPANDSEEALAKYRESRDQMHALGIRVSASVGFRTELRAFMAFDEQYMDGICRDIAGQPTKVRDWVDLKKEYPYYWGCANNPRYAEFLRSRVRLAMLGEPDALHFDDYRGTSAIALSNRCGGFCDSCQARFREYLRVKLAPERLRELGIEDLDAFRYDQFLAARGVSPEQYRKARGKAPLYAEFSEFHLLTSRDLVRELRDYAWELRGRRIPFACNCNPGSAENLLFAQLMDYFSCEVPHGAETHACSTAPLFTLKIGDMLGKSVAATASGPDWALVKEQNLVGLVRTWVAQAYAFGHFLMAPHYQWCFNQEKLSHWYTSKPEDYAHLYRFVRARAPLFDDYETAAAVALVYSNPDFRLGRRGAAQATSWLAERSIPFDLVAAGDDWLDETLTADDLAGYRAVLLPTPTALDGPQKQVLDDLAAAGKLFQWAGGKLADEAAFFDCLPPPITFEGAEGVIAEARVVPARPDAPALLHLLNRNYDAARDAVRKLGPFTVAVRRSLFGGREFTGAALYPAPTGLDPADPGASTPLPVRLQADGELIRLTIPELDLWGILVLQP